MTTGPLLDIDMSEVVQLQRELRAVSKDFANAMGRELRDPVRRGANDFKSAAKSAFPGWAAADAASGIRASSSMRSGYAIKREANSRFTQHGYADKTGAIRHPLYGNRGYWYDTDVGAQGWWSNAYDEIVPRATDEFVAAMMRIVDRLLAQDLSVTRTYRTIQSGKRAGQTTYTSSL